MLLMFILLVCVCVKGLLSRVNDFSFLYIFSSLSLHILHYQESRSSGIEWAQRLFSIYFEINTHKKIEFQNVFTTSFPLAFCHFIEH